MKTIIFSSIALLCIISATSACDMSGNGGAGTWGCWIINYVVNGTQINMCGFDPVNHYCKMDYGGELSQKYPGHCVPESAIVGVPSNQWFDAGDHSYTGLCPRCPPGGISSIGIGCTGNPACGGGTDSCGTCQLNFGPWGWSQQCA